MAIDLFRGTRVRLDRLGPKPAAEVYHRWMHDSELLRLMDSGISKMHSQSQHEKWQEKQLDSPTVNYFFHIIRLSDDKLIGDVGLDGIKWAHGECFVGIGIGERELWGQGYGTEAMRLILRFAFQEVNLRRVSLNVFEYNPRAIRSYEKSGFRLEGCVRGALKRGGRRWDIFYMGILRSEWEAQQAIHTGINHETDNN
jgi:RimJ/RimL family protein N-acetyltransferase